jgi:uncharacterized membrane protein
MPVKARTWKRDAASGLIVMVPLLVTAWVFLWISRTLANVPVLRTAIDPSLFWGSTLLATLSRAVIALVTFSILVLATGYLMRTAVGRFVEAEIDRFLNRVPVLRMVYNASKMAVETAVGGAENLQRPVKLETWNGIRMTAFKTGQTTADGREVLFLPTAPNITTGFVIEVEPDRFHETGERVEEALTRVISAGFAEDEAAIGDVITDDAADEEGTDPAPTGADDDASAGGDPTGADDADRDRDA